MVRGQTIVAVDPSEVTVLAPGESFTVEVNVTDVGQLGAWEFKLWYNTSFLDAIGVHSTWLTANNTDWIPLNLTTGVWDEKSGINDTIGRVFAGALLPLSTPFNGSGPLVTINFTATDVGTCTLQLTDTVLGGSSGPPDWITWEITHSALDGDVTVLPPPLPVISLNPFEYTASAPGEFFIIDVNITGVMNLQRYEFKLWFNTTLLNATGVIPGTVNPPNSSFIPGKMVGDPPEYKWTPLQNMSDGFVWAGASFPVGQSFIGDGILMMISFTALAAGNCTLHLNETVLVNSMEVDIVHLTLDGFVAVKPKIGDFHTHHINDATDDFPNDYKALVIPISGGNVTITPAITCTTFEDDVWKPNHHPCKLAQTLVVDNDWSDKDANYTYRFEDWIDYDWNDIVVNLYAVINYTIELEIRLESREAAWKNPFHIQTKAANLIVELQVYWNSTDYPEEHAFKLNPGVTVDIELFSESNPCDTAFVTIIPLIQPVAAFVYSPPYPKVCEDVTFNASSSTPGGGYVVSHEWDFGDASPHEFGMVVTHHYLAQGTYNVTLNVTNSLGVWGTETKTVTVKPRTYVLIITSTAGGTTDPIPGSHSYNEGTVVAVTALPEGNYVFDHWNLDDVNVGFPNPISVTMDKDHTLHAVFKEAPSPPVGGHAAPIDKSHVLDLTIGLTPEIGLVSISVLLAAMAVTIILIRRRNKTLNREH